MTTGIAIGAQHYLRGRTCAIARAGVSPDPDQQPHQVMSTTCTANRMPGAFAHLWPYVLGCVLALIVTTVLTFASGQASKKSMATTPAVP